MLCHAASPVWRAISAFSAGIGAGAETIALRVALSVSCTCAPTSLFQLA